MTFTHHPNLTDDVSLVRFHIGDTNPEGHFLEDETIQYWVDQGSAKTAVIACLQYIISQLSAPDFKQDWLSVSMGDARKGYEELLKQKRIELGISSVFVATTTSSPYREDSLQTDGNYAETAE